MALTGRLPRSRSGEVKGTLSISRSLFRKPIPTSCPALPEALLRPYAGSAEPSMISQHASRQHIADPEQVDSGCTYGLAVFYNGSVRTTA